MFCGAKAFFPPFEAGIFHLFPIVNRISPKLTVGAERIRRATRNSFWVQIFVKKKFSRFRPDVRGIKRNIYRNIADDFYSVFVCIAPEFFPLGEKFKLEEADKRNFVRKFLFLFRKSLFVPKAEFFRPFGPGFSAEFFFYCCKKGIFKKPFFLLS